MRRLAVGGLTENPVQFSEAQLYFELNNTDEDLGIHGSIDGDDWTKLSYQRTARPSASRLFTQNTLTTQGMTQLFFESANRISTS